MKTKKHWITPLGACSLLLFPTVGASAGSLQTQSNEVADGAIVVDFSATDDKRADWVDIPVYTPLDVDDVTPLLSTETLSIAHDSTNFYFRWILDSTADPVVNPQQSFFGSHHAILFDTDQDRSVGFIGDDGDPALTSGVYPIGGDYYLEGPALFRFGNFTNPPGPGQDQEAFTFGSVIPFGSLTFDDDPVTDIEFLIPRSSLGNPEAFDFVVFNSQEDFTIDEAFPNNAFDPAGDFFTYSTLPIAMEIDGDYNGDGFVSQADLDLVLLNWGANVVPPAWVATAQFDGVQVSQNELDGVLLNWGDGTPPSANAIPEPASLALIAGIGSLALLSRRRSA